MHPFIKYTFLWMTCSFLLVACQSDQGTTIAKAGLQQQVIDLKQVPKLLQRSDKIQQGKEWEDVQNSYTQYRQQLIDGSGKAALQLAQLFTIEARVTGEHGHYYPAALELVDKALEAMKDDKDLKFMLLSTKASVQLSQHEFKAALKTAQQAVALNPYNAQIYGVLTDAYVELGDYESAIKNADKMISIRPDLRSYARVSYLREIHGKTTESIQAMELAVAAGYPGQEETAWTRLQLGQLYERYGKDEAAKEQYQAILINRPDYPFATAALAELEVKAGNLSKAEELLQQAADVIPEVGFHEQLAHIYKEMNRTEELNKTLDEIMVMLQDDVDSGHNMNLEYAAIYRDLKTDYDGALKYVLTEYEARPANIDVNCALAGLYHAKGDVEKAKTHLQEAMKTNAQYPDLMELRSKMKL